MEYTPETADRELIDYVVKNINRGTISDRTLKRLKRMGININSKQDKLEIEIESEDEPTVAPNNASGKMSIDEAIMRAQEIEMQHYYATKAWKPKSVIAHTDEFFQFINSMLFGFFIDKIHYRPYEIYKAQAQYFFNHQINPYSETNHEARRDLVFKEFARCDDNTLYFAMRYGIVKEGSNRAGKIPYVPKEHNAILFYLLDCGYSFLLGKPRQIFATTTMGLYIIKKLLFQENFYMKFITEDIKTGMEILDDKVKVPYGYLPSIMRPQVARDYIQGLRVGKKLDKGEYSPPNSRIEVLAPSKTAINGGSPQVVLVDEVATVPDLIPMIFEQRPTMYIDKHQDGNLELVRQLIAWSTGTSSNKGKQAYQKLFADTIDLWNKKDFMSCLFVPLFFSWHTRCNESVYRQAQKTYYSGNAEELEGISIEDQKIIFHMHYPSTWRDMFGMTTTKLVPKELIDGDMERIRNLKVGERPIPGFFEPVYDYTQPIDNVDIGIPYKLLDARFIPFDDAESDRSRISCYMFKSRDKFSKYRFYQGTDPISTETGHSKFASTVWDEEFKTVACLLNYRKKYEHREAYLQSVLMSLYYDNRERGTKHGIPELIENNIGTSYRDFKETIGYANNVVYNKELPLDLQGGGAYWGFNSKQKRKELMVMELKDTVTLYHANINHSIYFGQLDTYAPTINASGTSWCPVDKKLYFDDALDSLALARICRKAHSHLTPIRFSDDTSNTIKKVVYETVRLKDGTLTLEAKTINA